MITSHRRLIALTAVLVAMLAMFAVTSGWRRRLREESSRSRRVVADVERAQAQLQARVSQESQLEASLLGHPHDVEVRLELAHLRLTLRGAPAALPVLQAVEGRTQDPRVLRALAECYRLTRREDKSLALLNRAAQIAPGDGDVHVDRAHLFSLLLWFSEAEAELRLAERLHADPRQIAFVRSLISWQKADYVEARKVLDAALRQYPEDLPLARQLAVVVNSEGRYAEAAERLERLSESGGEIEALVSLAKVYRQQNTAQSLEKAMATVRKVLAIHPQHAQARLQLGRVLRLRGQMEEACKVLEALYKEHPRTRGLAFELYEILRAHGLERAAEPYLVQHRRERKRRQAMSQAVTVLMAYPERATAQRDMAARCLELELYGRAIVSCERALTLDPRLRGVKAMLAEAKAKAEKATPGEGEPPEPFTQGRGE